jgi:histidinol-phosphate phosphatase family protein
MRHDIFSAKFLFLDRDGVINVRPMNDYVKTKDEFKFEKKVLEALAILAKHFERIFVVTNQQGIGKTLMTEKDLKDVHAYMLELVTKAGGKIDEIYYCPHLHTDNCFCRKPSVGMALKARKQFPEIRFLKSVMVGDTLNDMTFGKKAGMKTVLISQEDNLQLEHPRKIDAKFGSLFDFAMYIENHTKFAH